MKLQRDIVQIKNPKTQLYTKIDRTNGIILGTKRTGGPFKNVPIVHSRRRS